MSQHAERVDGRQLLALPAHLATKFAALLDRPESQPGEKDRHEVWGLLEKGIAPGDVAEIMRASEVPVLQVVTAIRDVFTFLADMELTRAERRHLRAFGHAFVEATERVLSRST